MQRLILMDLDETLLRSDRTISDYTLSVLKRCQTAGALVGFCTARGECNARVHIRRVQPDVVIASGGAQVRCRGEIICRSLFSLKETRDIIAEALRLTQGSCEITCDTPEGLYWNYREHPRAHYPDWDEINYTDYDDFNHQVMKFTMLLPDDRCAEAIAASAGGCDWFRFVNSRWYKFTKPGVTKVDAIRRLAAHLKLSPEDIIAFGDDRGDLEMLTYCGLGAAVANAIPEVLQAADLVVPSNDEDGVARCLETLLGDV